MDDKPKRPIVPPEPPGTSAGNAAGGSPRRRAQTISQQFAIALELPFVLVASIVIGGFLGYLLDRWLHTKFLFMIVLGGLGLYAGVREILRRLPVDNGNRDK